MKEIRSGHKNETAGHKNDGHSYNTVSLHIKKMLNMVTQLLRTIIFNVNLFKIKQYSVSQNNNAVQMQ